MSESYACSACGFAAKKWFGRCPECGSWSTAVAPREAPALELLTLSGDSAAPDRISTGITELDRVLGGGVVEGSVVLLAGEPGIGKSTLVLEALAEISRNAQCVLVTGEESPAQVSARAGRLRLEISDLKVAATTSLSATVVAMEAECPAVIVVDSVQTLHDDDIQHAVGSPTQVRQSAAALVEVAKRTGTAVILVGHVTKEGSVAGPKALEHVVDAVLMLEGDRSGTLRLLRAEKNRFGPCDETGVFVMGERGLTGVPDPSAMFLEDRHPEVAGSVVFPTLDGTRTLLVEVQALTISSGLPQPRRVAIGLDHRRVALIAGVLQQNEASLSGRDLFAAVAGGITIKEPACDLAVALACWSSVTDKPVDPRLVVLGEVGLGGEVRRVQAVQRRLAEAARMGFTRALVPRGNAEPRDDIEVVSVTHLTDACAAASLRDSVTAQFTT